MSNKKIFLTIIFLTFISGVAIGILFESPPSAHAIDWTDLFKNLFVLPTPSPNSAPLSLPTPRSVPAVLPSAEAYENQIVSVVDRVNASVVSVIITKNVPVLEQYYINPFDDFFGDFGFPGFEIPQYRQKGTKKQEIGGGTGFVISQDGLILTNNHVVSDTSADYTVLFNDGSKLPATVIGRDPVLDLAVIKVNQNNLKPIALGDSDKLKIGQTAIAIGNALGEFRNTVSVGVISGLKRNIQASSGSKSEELRNVIQTDAAINPGNSGGPLLNLRGEVIGVNVAVAVTAQNIGFAIPINDAKAVISEVVSKGKFSVPYLGVRYSIVTPDIAKEKNLPVDYGALLLASSEGPAVEKNSPAAAAGLKEGDIILEVNGKRIDSDNQLVYVIRKYNVGDTVTLKVMRDGKEISLNVRLGARP